MEVEVMQSRLPAPSSTTNGDRWRTCVRVSERDLTRSPHRQTGRPKAPSRHDFLATSPQALAAPPPNVGRMGLGSASRTPPELRGRDNVEAMATTSSPARGSELQELGRKQAALRRVATLAAGDFDAPRLFRAVCEELGGVLGVESTDMLRFEPDGTATVVGSWAAGGGPFFPVGMRVPLDG